MSFLSFNPSHFLRPEPSAARLIIAGLLTVLGLPYLWGRSFIGWQLVGRPETAFAAWLVALLVAIALLVFHVGDQPWLAGRTRRVVAAAAAGWLLANTLLFALRTGSLVPRTLVIGAYLPGSLAVPWVAWMFLRRWTWWFRAAWSAVLLALLAAFLAVFRVEGLSGDAQIDFAWRWKPSPVADVLRHDPGDGVRHDRDREAAADWKEDPQRDYPQFLGPNRTGVLETAEFAGDWSAAPPREVWRRPVGAGWGAFAVVGDHAITQEQREERECIVCYRLQTGDEVWLHADQVRFASSLGGPGPRATPTVRDGRVYTVGATGLLNCLDARSGRAFWSVDILEDNGGHPIAHGVCGSPLLLDDAVVVGPTGDGAPSLAAYDSQNGRRVWRGGTRAASYSSPAPATLCGVRQILLFNARGLSGHDAANGDELWHFEWTNSVHTNVAQPIVLADEADRVLISSGYGRGAVLLELANSGGVWQTKPLWTTNHLKTKFCTAVHYGGFFYGLDDGILTCLDERSGARKWKSGRYGHGQVLRVAERLLVQCENGDVLLVSLGERRPRELGRIAALTSKTWNHPALAGRYLVVRNDREAACYELPP